MKKKNTDRMDDALCPKEDMIFRIHTLQFLSFVASVHVEHHNGNVVKCVNESLNWSQKLNVNYSKLWQHH